MLPYIDKKNSFTKKYKPQIRFTVAFYSIQNRKQEESQLITFWSKDLCFGVKIGNSTTLKESKAGKIGIIDIFRREKKSRRNTLH